MNPIFLWAESQQSVIFRELNKNWKFALNLGLSHTVPKPMPNLYRCTPHEQMNKCNYMSSQDAPEPITRFSQSGPGHMLWTWRGFFVFTCQQKSYLNCWASTPLDLKSVVLNRKKKKRTGWGDMIGMSQCTHIKGVRAQQQRHKI